MAGEPVTERELLEGCRRGDREATAELLRRHQPDLLRIVRRLVGQASVAEEIVQETFLRTLEQIDRIDPERGVRGWMLTTALNFARLHLKRGKRSPPMTHAPEEANVLFASAAVDPEQRMLLHEQRRRYLSALERLPHKLREILILHYVEELPFHDIAKMLRLPATALRMRAVRARHRLVALLRESV